MKLEEQFRKIIDDADIESFKNDTKQCVLVVENFAIGFLDWYMSTDTSKYESTKQLLEIYKETL